MIKAALWGTKDESKPSNGFDGQRNKAFAAGQEATLGYSYDTGVGVSQNFAEAYKWYLLAVAQNENRAKK